MISTSIIYITIFTGNCWEPYLLERGRLSLSYFIHFVNVRYFHLNEIELKLCGIEMT